MAGPSSTSTTQGRALPSTRCPPAGRLCPVCAGLPVVLAWVRGKPRSAAPSSHVQAWFRADWKAGRWKGRPLPVGSLTARPVSSLCALSAPRMWKCLSSCLLWAHCCRPACRCRPQVLAAALTSHRVHVVRAGRKQGMLAVAWEGWAAGRGSRKRHACLHPCMLRILLPGGAWRVDPLPLPCCLCVLKKACGGGGLLQPKGDLKTRASCPCLPRACVQGASGHRLACQVGGCGQAAWEREGPEVPTQPVQGPRPCSAPLCVFHNSPLIFLTFPGHPRSSRGPDGSLGGCWLSPLKLGPRAQTRV